MTLVPWKCQGCHVEKQITVAAERAGKKWCSACSRTVAVEQRKAWKLRHQVRGVRGKMTVNE